MTGKDETTGRVKIGQANDSEYVLNVFCSIQRIPLVWKSRRVRLRVTRHWRGKRFNMRIFND